MRQQLEAWTCIEVEFSVLQTIQLGDESDALDVKEAMDLLEGVFLLDEGADKDWACRLMKSRSSLL